MDTLSPQIDSPDPNQWRHLYMHTPQFTAETEKQIITWLREQGTPPERDDVVIETYKMAYATHTIVELGLQEAIARHADLEVRVRGVEEIATFLEEAGYQAHQTAPIKASPRQELSRHETTIQEIRREIVKSDKLLWPSDQAHQG